MDEREIQEFIENGCNMNIETIQMYIDSVEWVFSKTYAKTAPHEYTIRGWRPDLEHLFVRFALYIRKHGLKQWYWRKQMTYFYLGEWKYWTMGDPIDETIVLNRAKWREYSGSKWIGSVDTNERKEEQISVSCPTESGEDTEVEA